MGRKSACVNTDTVSNLSSYLEELRMGKHRMCFLRGLGFIFSDGVLYFFSPLWLNLAYERTCREMGGRGRQR